MPRSIQLDHHSIEALQFESQEVTDLFHFLDQYQGYAIPEGELSIALVDDKTQCDLHEQFLNDPTTTDVITFPGDPLMDFAGEICVNVELAHSVAPQNQQTFSQELTLYLVHGWLHLAGLDDHADEDIAQMRAAEATLMNALSTHHKIPKFLLP